MKKEFFFILLTSLLLLSGCINITNIININLNGNNPISTQKKKLPLVKSVIVSLVTPYGDRVEEDYAKSVGFSFKFKVESPHPCKFVMCLNSFSSGYWKITGSKCSEIYVESPDGLYYVTIPDGGRIYLTQFLDHDITEDILMNECYNYTQTYIVTGCLKKDQVCKFSIDDSTQGYLHIYNIYSKYDITKNRYTLNFMLSYYPHNYTYITDNPKVLQGECYLSNVVSPNTGKVSVSISVMICENKCEISSKTVYLSSSGESKQVTIYLPPSTSNRDIITMIINASYIVFKQEDFGSITILSNQNS